MPDGIKSLENQAPVEIEYPPGILDKLKTLPKSHSGVYRRTWEPWEDDLIKTRWNDYVKQDIAKLIGVSITTLKSRWHELQGEKK
jgi:hypothetical protein